MAEKGQVMCPRLNSNEVAEQWFQHAASWHLAMCTFLQLTLCPTPLQSNWCLKIYAACNETMMKSLDWPSPSFCRLLRDGKEAGFGEEKNWLIELKDKMSCLSYWRSDGAGFSLWFYSISFWGKGFSKARMNEARPRYVINRPAYSINDFDEEFERKSRSYPLGEKIKNLFRYVECCTILF